jgi:predicted transcriptional regulator
MTTRKKAGRPATDPATHRPRATFTLSPEALRLLDSEAARTGKSKSAIVDEALRRLAGREGER